MTAVYKKLNKSTHGPDNKHLLQELEKSEILLDIVIGKEAKKWDHLSPGCAAFILHSN